MNDVEKRLLVSLSEAAEIVARFQNETGINISDTLSIVGMLAEYISKNTDDLPCDELANKNSEG